MEYKFVYAKKAQVSKGRDSAVVVSSMTTGKAFSFGQEEYQLIQLFDGENRTQQIIDRFFENTGLEISPSDLSSFVAKMRDGGLLQAVPNSNAFMEESEFMKSAVEESSDDDVDDEQATEDHDGFRMDEDRIVKQASKISRSNEFDVDDDEAYEGRAPSPAHSNGARHVEDAYPIVPSPASRALDTVDPESIGSQAGTAPLSVSKVVVPLPLDWLAGICKFLALPSRSTILFLLVFVAAAGALFIIGLERDAIISNLLGLDPSASTAVVVLALVMGINLFVQLFRAGGYQSGAHEYPRFGMAFTDGFIPRFQAELPRKSANSVRMGWRLADRASLFAVLALLCAGTAVWWSGWLGGGAPDVVAAGSGAIAIPAPSAQSPGVGSGSGWLASALLINVLTALVMLNPLSNREGYRLLANWLGAADIKDRAYLAAVWGASADARTEMIGNPISKGVLSSYWLCAIAFIALSAGVVYWFLRYWFAPWESAAAAGAWVGLVLIAQILPFARASRRAKAIRKALNYDLYQSRGTRGRPAARGIFWYGLVGAVLLALGLLPYDYEAGGEAVILPAQRAGVPALISGDIREIFVKEGDLVSLGQVIARMADEEQRANVSVTRSKLDELQRLDLLRVGASESEIALARQKVKTASTRAEFSRSRAKRLEQLAKRGHLAQQTYQDALGEAQIDRERLEETRRDLEVLTSGSRPEEIKAVEAEIAQVMASLAYDEQQQQYTEVKAPIAGRIVSGTLKYAVGEYLKKGDFVATIENTTSVDAEIRVSEADIGEIKVGSQVRVKAWAYPDREFLGAVRSIAPNAETGDSGRVVRVVTVISNPDELLKSELTGYAKVRGDTQPAWRAFTRMLRRFFTLELWSWIP